MLSHSEASGVVRLVGIAGSLRAHSYNRALLRAAQELSPPDLVIEIQDLAELPLFNEDLETPASGAPAAVEALRSAVRGADGLLLVTPEYNHGMPGVMKNAVDWLSQPRHGNPLEWKPVALMGASTGIAGSARGQSQLRQALVLTSTMVMPQPEILVGRAHEKFDSTGCLRDEATRRILAGYLVHVENWIRRQQRANEMS